MMGHWVGLGLLATALGWPGTADGQVLYNPKRDHQAEAAARISEEIRSGAVFDKMLANLTEVGKLDEKSLIESAELGMRAEVNGWRTWGDVQGFAARLENALNAAPLAKSAEAQADVDALQAQIAATKARSAALKSSLMQSVPGNQLAAVGLWIERVGKLEMAYEWLEKFLARKDASAARPAIAKEMSVLLQRLGEKYQAFEDGMPPRPSALWLQSRLDLLWLQEESFERRVGIQARREKEEKDLRSLLRQTQNLLKKLKPEYLDMQLVPALARQAAVVDGEEALEDMITALLDAGALAARYTTPAQLAALRETQEERAESIREMAARARLYEVLVGTGVERLALYYKGGVKPETLAAIVQSLATVGLIPAIALK
jgi:hypothetical protein